VANEPVEGPSAGWLNGFYRWLKKPASQTGPQPVSAGDDSPDRLPARIGHYAVRRKLGAGGMGVVYEAEDERLKRSVALKMMLSLPHDENARRRFWREARAAASVNHPHICQIYEVGEEGGVLFIAMELLDGEPLSALLKRGPISVDQALPIALDMLAALGAIHARGIVHRDLKPSNVFLGAHGVKLLDFGLARPEVKASLDSMDRLTHANAVLGTPGYMAPEMITGDPVDARTDLFAAGAILFEMLSGRRAFTGNTVTAVLHATLTEQPPALAGSATVAAVDRVIRRALAKKPDARPPSADAMAEQLNAMRNLDSQEPRAMARALTRIVVLPFRVLRPDSETDFLAFSLPDAITTSLAGNGSLIVRSSAKAAKFAGDAPDLQALAVEADVDRVVMGTLLRAGDQLRAATQLVEAPEGTLVSSHTVQAALGDLFHMQDDIARRVVEGLALGLPGERLPSASPDAPRNPQAYELYLRANALSRRYEDVPKARALYEQCLELDPLFAPAWAHLGRCHRIIGKIIEADPDSDRRAEDAFIRAIALNPRLSIAHKFYANLEADTRRSPEAMVRLLNAATRQGNDAELFAGLVHACRYCGLFDESLAAHAEARRLDPTVPTSFLQTLLLNGEVDRLMDVEPSERAVAQGDLSMPVMALGLSGRREEARRVLAEIGQDRAHMFSEWRAAALSAWLDGRVEDMISTFARFASMKFFDDPDVIFRTGWFFCDVGEPVRGLELMKQAVARRYFPAVTLAKWPHFDALRGNPEFQALVADAEAGRQRARDAFREAGGDRLLAR
jgi:eukaryotic-like serine/threonine-protein kinase